MFVIGEMVEQTLVHPHHGVNFSKENKQLMLVTIWKDFKKVMMKKSQSQQLMYRVSPLMYILKMTVLRM